MNSELRIRQGKARLLQTVIQNCRLSELIWLGEEIIGYPLALSTVNHFVWYASEAIPKNPIIPQTGAATITTQILYKEDLGSFLGENTNNFIVREEGNYCYCFCALRAGKRLHGYSTMVSSTPFSESDILLHKAFCDILAVELEKQEAVERVLLLSAEENLLMHLLDDPSYSYSNRDIEEIFSKGIRYIEAITVRSLTHGVVAPDIDTMEALRTMLKCDICFGYQGGLVIFAPMGTAKRSKAELEHFTQKRDMVVGISYPFNGLGNLLAYYKQAIKALEYCERWNKLVLFYSEIVFYDILYNISDSNQLTALCNLDIYKIKQHDLAHGTTYCETLKAFIESKFNVIKTAELLGIHRNSVLSRISKIKDIVLDQNVFLMDGLFSSMLLDFLQVQKWSDCAVITKTK